MRKDARSSRRRSRIGTTGRARGLILLGALALLALIASATTSRAAAIPALTLAQTLRVSGEPWDIAIDPAGTRAFVTDATENTLDVFDLATGSVVAYVPTGERPNHIALLGSRAYVSNFDGRSVTVVDLTTLQAVEDIAAGGLGLAADPASGRLYAAAGSRIAVLDTATDRLVASIAAPAGANLWGLAFDAKTRRLFATDIANPRVLAIDVSTNTVVGEVAIDAPARFGIGAAAGKVFVASDTDRAAQLTLIDAATLRVLSKTTAPAFASGLAFDGASTVYAVSQAEHAVTAVSTTSYLVTSARAVLDAAHAPNAVAVGPTGVIAATGGGPIPPLRAAPATPRPVVQP